MQTFSYLTKYSSNETELREAALAWFREARFGLFLHYGLYSLIGKGEWYMHHAGVSPADYAVWKDRFTAEQFDADFITDLALTAGMTYVNLTTRHHDGFCLFETAQHDFHSVNSPARRDLVGEMAEACRRKGLGFFIYYSYGLDWRDPNFDVKNPEKMARYVAFMQAQLRELSTNYGPIAGFWFDLVGVTYAHPEVFAIQESYDLIHKLQPQALVSYKQGALGTEDYASCEFKIESLADFPPVKKLGPEAVARATRAWELNREKPLEICTTLQKGSWGHNDVGQPRRTSTEVRELMAGATWQRANLLLNAGPLPDGSFHPDDERILREVGEQLKQEGWPEPAPPASERHEPVVPDQGAQAR